MTKTKILYSISIGIAALYLSGCATQGSIPLSSSAVPKMAEVVVVEPRSMDPHYRSHGVIENPPDVLIIAGIVEAFMEDQRKEREEILKRYEYFFSTEYPKKLLQERLQTLSRMPLDVAVDEINFVPSGSTASFRKSPKSGEAKALLTIQFDQTLSLDLSKLRLKLKAKAVGLSGEELMIQNIFFLPGPVEGVTKEAAIKTWSDHDGKVYREKLNLGVEALVDALNFSFFSYKKGQDENLTDAADVLKRTNCYGGDYDVGIPMDAYKSGKILAVRENYVAIKLKNNDILTYPTCK